MTYISGNKNMLILVRLRNEKVLCFWDWNSWECADVRVFMLPGVYICFIYIIFNCGNVEDWESSQSTLS